MTTRAHNHNLSPKFVVLYKNGVNWVKMANQNSGDPDFIIFPLSKCFEIEKKRVINSYNFV